MSFTLFSVIILLIFALAIFKRVLKGLKRGFLRSAISLSITIFSMICSAAISVFISRLSSQYVSDMLFGMIGALGEYSETFPSIKIIFTGIVEVFIAPLIFVAGYLLIKLVINIVIYFVARRAWKKSPDSPTRLGKYRSLFANDNPSYINEDAPWHVRHDRLLGALTSALCGFISMLIVFSPLIGLVDNLKIIYKVADEKDFDWSTLSLDKENMEYVDGFVNDGIIATLGKTGGLLIYDGMSSTVLIEGNRPVTIRSEVTACVDISNDLLSIFDAVSANGGLDDAQLETLSGIVNKLHTSDTLMLLTVDVVSGIGSKWVYNEPYLGIEKPHLGDSFDTVLDMIWSVLGACETDCVVDDLNMLINIFKIMKDGGLDTLTENSDIMTSLEEKGILDKLYAEIQNNTCMMALGAMDKLMNSTLQVMAKSVVSQAGLLSTDQKSMLYSDFAASINSLNKTNMSIEQRVDVMTQNTMQYAEEYGYQMPETVAKMAATSMLNSLDEGEKMTEAKMEECFKRWERGEFGDVEQIEGGTEQ